MNNDSTSFQDLRSCASSTSYTFKKIRKDMVYVDKTGYISKLVAKEGISCFFLSRPRRFGKSLLLSTLKSLFKGEEELFRNLYIHDKWDWSDIYPVIHLDISRVKGNTAEEINKSLAYRIVFTAKLEHQLSIDPTLLADDAFEFLVTELYCNTGKKVVILIDEYDAPILNKLIKKQNPEIARSELASFYHVLKQMDEYIRFVFITGVSKFSRVSIFSKLNNLRDISLDPEYSAICGYTQEELEHYFGVLLQQFDKDLFREKYNGYNWLGESVYNPVDAGLALNTGRLWDYWYITGSTEFLQETLKQRGLDATILTGQVLESKVVNELSLHKFSNEALLFQTGYLTISEYIEDKETGRPFFRLKFPNEEVRYSYLESLFTACFPDISFTTHRRNFIDLGTALAAGDIEKLGYCIQNIFAIFSYTYYQHEGNTMANYEAFYTAVVAATLCGVVNEIVTEEHTPRGRIDLFARKNDLYYIFEMKMVDKKDAGSGVRQIIEKGYAEKYRRPGRSLYLVGMDFSAEKKSIDSIYYQMDGDTELRATYTY